VKLDLPCGKSFAIAGVFRAMASSSVSKSG
jgi:hypothetical protein